jgi:hypothetical protein
MQEVGEFREGYYITTDADGNEHRADGRNAVWETFTGLKLVYPTPRYAQPVMMEPDGFPWRPVPGAGVSHKVLGRFTEDDVYLANYRWDEPGGVLTLTPERTQLLWIIDGRLTANGEAYDPETVIISELGESTPLAGTQNTQAVVFGLTLPVPVPA